MNLTHNAAKENKLGQMMSRVEASSFFLATLSV